MKILVYDVAASNGGALTILKNVYEYAKNSEFEWLFVLSVADLRETDNIKVLKFPEVKQSWRNRLNFDKTQALKLIEEYKPDTVLNLQNVALKCSCEQVLYLHQPLPFCKHKFRVWQGGGALLDLPKCYRADDKKRIETSGQNYRSIRMDERCRPKVRCRRG